ncbi:MAG: TolB family protein, partial [Nocardioidaceae bacterium]
MCSDVANLTSTMLNIRTWQAFDVDAAGRVLAGWDDSGTVQLVEIDTDGTRTPLTALPGACSGRYIPGRREVVVQHDTDGNERAQLSTLSLSPLPAQPVGLDGLSPLVADPEHIHALLDVTADTLVYATNRRNDVDFDVMVRRLGGRSERTLYDDGGYVVGAAMSHDGESVAITQLSLVPASSQVSIVGPRAAGPRGQVTAPDEHAMHGDLDGMGGGVAWAPGDRALIVVSNHEREFRGVARVDTDGQRWLWLLGDESADHMAWVAPDGASMVVGRLVDGAYSLGVYEVDGSRRYRLRLPADGYPTVVWSADGSRFAVTLTAPTLPGSIYLVEAAHG